MVRSVSREVLIGAVAGLVATGVTDQAERLFSRMTPRAELAREPEIPGGSSSKATASLLCRTIGYQPGERTLRRIKSMIHYGLGTTPPAHRFPPSAHLRGLLTHAVWGVAVAATVEALYRIEGRNAP